MITLAVIAVLVVAAAVTSRRERVPVDPELLRRHGPRLPSPRERHCVTNGVLHAAWMPDTSSLPTS